jgi:hypothetical protein
VFDAITEHEVGRGQHRAGAGEVGDRIIAVKANSAPAPRELHRKRSIAVMSHSDALFRLTVGARSILRTPKIVL